MTFGALLLMLFLFFLLGRCADYVVENVNKIRLILGLKVFLTGILLGFFTSLPELMLSVNALLTGAPDLSLGNLMGSVMVIYGLILGLSIILNRTIKTDGKLVNFLPIFLYLILPFLFGLDGTISRIESLLLVLWYFWLVSYLFHQHTRERTEKHTVTIRSEALFFDGIKILGGLVAIAFLSHLIIQTTEYVLAAWHIQGFVVGLLLFALGTNLPEIIVMVRSWKKRMKELSLSHLVGSSLFDPLLIGIFSFIRPFRVQRTISYYDLLLFSVLLFASVCLFYRSDKEFRRSEGIVLVFIYACFFLTEVSLAFIIHG